MAVVKPSQLKDRSDADAMPTPNCRPHAHAQPMDEILVPEQTCVHMHCMSPSDNLTLQHCVTLQTVDCTPTSHSQVQFTAHAIKLQSH